MIDFVPKDCMPASGRSIIESMQQNHLVVRKESADSGLDLLGSLDIHSITTLWHPNHSPHMISSVKSWKSLCKIRTSQS